MQRERMERRGNRFNSLPLLKKSSNVRDNLGWYLNINRPNQRHPHVVWHEVIGPIVVAVACASSAFAGPRFSVADSIEMTRIVDPDKSQGRFAAAQLKFSPDGQNFFIVTRRGSLKSGLNRYELRVFNLREVGAWARRTTKHKAAPYRTLATFDTANVAGGIANARWATDGKSVAFVGRSENASGQVYIVDIGTASPRQLTQHRTAVGEFGISDDAAVIVYSAYQPPDWTHRRLRGYVVESEHVKALSVTDPERAVPEVHFFVQNSRTSKEPFELRVSPSVIPRGIWVSPSGNSAVALMQPGVIPPRWWTAYESFAALNKQSAHGNEPSAEAVIGNPSFGRLAPWLNQFMLIDVRTGAVQPAIAAPSGSGLAGLVVSAVWQKDERSVLLVNSFLPIEGEPSERQRRKRTPSIVKFDVATGTITPIVDVLLEVAGRQYQLLGFQGSVNSFSATWSAGANFSDVHKVFTLQGTQWIEQVRGSRRTGGPEVTILEDLNSPPEVALKLSHRTAPIRITDLNPHFRDIVVPAVVPFQWTARSGERWDGGLVLPPDFDPAVRYPLVLQTYGFESDEFLTDGPTGKTAAYAARPLASRGIVVLQMPFDRRGYLGPNESLSQLEMMESAIDALDAKRLIDRNRVGVIGFSRTGMHVMHAITFAKPEYPIAAATICDSISDGYLSYINRYGQEYPGMLRWERMIGAPFWAEGRALWLERSASFNLHRIRTPLRLEHIGAYPPDYWDTFALLKRHSKPVELIHLPEGTHQLVQPFSRYTSQEGNVDWFDFWLNRHEDPAPEKAEQYVRWRGLRKQFEKDREVKL